MNPAQLCSVRSLLVLPAAANSERSFPNLASLFGLQAEGLLTQQSVGRRIPPPPPKIFFLAHAPLAQL